MDANGIVQLFNDKLEEWELLFPLSTNYMTQYMKEARAATGIRTFPMYELVNFFDGYGIFICPIKVPIPKETSRWTTTFWPPILFDDGGMGYDQSKFWDSRGEAFIAGIEFALEAIQQMNQATLN